MKNLKNKSVLIGRDPEKPRLIAAIEVGGKMKQLVIDSNVVIPNSISRCNAAQRVAHCRVDIDANGELTIHNLKDANVTYVDGVAVISKHITAQSKVGLGKDCFAIDVNSILTSIKSALGVDIRPLKQVWDEYQAELDRIAKDQADRAKRRMLPMLIGLGSGALAPILKSLGEVAFYVTIVVSVVAFGVMLRAYLEKDTSMEDRKKAAQKLKQNYLCPACKKYMEGREYSLLVDDGKCRKCGAAFLYE